MFDGDSSLKKLDLSNFDTGYANGLSDMFNNCTSLEELDISNFDLHYSDSNNIFVNDNALKRLKTPKRSTNADHPNGLRNLPVPMMDDEGNVYTVLNGFVPTQTWLEKQE
jgi:surface protein